MISKSILKLFYTYSEVALSPAKFSQLIQSRRPALPEIMHNFHLFDSRINVFDYEYFLKVGHFLLDSQKKLSNQEILLILNLGIKFNCKSEVLWKHLQAEIHQRLHNTMFPILNAQIQKDTNDMQNIMMALEKNSKDIFQVLKEDEEGEIQKQNENQTSDGVETAKNDTRPSEKKSKVSIKLIEPTGKLEQSLKIHKKQDNITKFTLELVEILIWYETKNTKMLTLLLETQIHPLVNKRTPESLLRFSQLFVYICQVSMKEFKENNSKYTQRAVNGIEKFQGGYLTQLLLLMKEVLPICQAEQIKYLSDVLGSFPIKKRNLRGQVVHLISNQWKMRGVQIDEEQKKKLQSLLGNDQKQIEQFRQTWKALPDNENNQSVSQTEKGSEKAI